MKRYMIMLLLAAATVSEMQATVYTVNSLGATSTGAGTSGTLAFCINQANAAMGPHTIQFSVAGTIFISSGISLPALVQAITINGTTAPGYAGSPVVIIDGTGTLGGDGIVINGANCTLLGLEIRYMPYSGIAVNSGAANFRIGSAAGGCVVRNCGYYGIEISGADNGVIESNRIGTNAAGTACEPNDYDGIDMNGNANGNLILNNHIACNGYNGLQIGNCHNNIVKGNIFGPLLASCTANGYRGIDLEGGSSGNTIGGILPGEANKVAGNLYWGIEVKEAGTIRNVISGNSMSCNDYGAIEVNTGGNNNIAAPVITAATTTSVSGTSAGSATIEIFRAHDPTAFGCPGTPGNQGADYLGSATATAGGTWSISGTFDGFIVATQTTSGDGTSEFSPQVYTGAPAIWANGCAGPAAGGCINPPPPVNTTPPVMMELCAGSTATLSASGSGTLYWFDLPAAGMVLGTGSTFITPVLMDTTTFYVGDSTCDTSLTRTAITVNVIPPAVVTQSVFICDGESILVGTHVYSVSGVYTDTLSGAAGCDSIITTFLEVNLPIDVSVLNLGDAATANASGMIYQWIDCGTGLPIPGATGQSYTATITGYYAVIITDSSGCSDTSACEPLIIMDAVAPEEGAEVKLWPNPVTSGVLNVKSAGECVVEIYSLHGQMMLSEKVQGGVSELHVRHLADGIYLLRLSGADGVISKRLVLSALSF